MSVSDESQPDDAQRGTPVDGLLQALIHWQKPDQDLTPLIKLRLFRQVQGVERPTALQQVLQQGLDCLAQRHPTQAQVVQSRLLTDEKIETALRRLRLSEAHFHRLRKEGLVLLVETLLALESEAQTAYCSQMMQRLETATYSNLVGQEAEVAALGALLQTPAAPWLVAITGIGGIGKTTLADALTRDQITSPKPS